MYLLVCSSLGDREGNYYPATALPIPTREGYVWVADKEDAIAYARTLKARTGIHHTTYAPKSRSEFLVLPKPDATETLQVKVGAASWLAYLRD